MNRVWKIVGITAAVLVVLVGIGAGVVYAGLRSVHEYIPIVSAPPSSTNPGADQSLVLLEGTPDDIDEDYALPEVENPDDTPIYQKVRIDEDVINILMLGQDSGLEDNVSTRSDSCFLISYDRSKGSVKMVSILRDTWTHIEGHGYNRVNAAYSFGGIGLLINTLNDMYDLDIQHYVITGFDEFADCIDQLGGLDMDLTEKEVKFINDRLPDADLKAGPCHLNGAMALLHARNRRTGNGDFGRTQRQRDIMLTSYKTLLSSRNPAQYLSFIQYALNNVRTNMEPDELVTLGMEVLQTENLDISYARLPYDGTWSYAEKDGKSVLSVDFEENTKLIKDFLYNGGEGLTKDREDN